MSMCAVDGCLNPAHCRGWCVAHYGRWYRNGSTGAVETSTGAPTGAAHPRWTSAPTYHGAHHRVSAKRGPARHQMCASCGGPAAHWAYNHKDPNQIISPDGRPYSVDPDFYEPMCASCHTKADHARTGATPIVGCSVDGCERAHAARGLCKYHHRLARRAA